MRSEALAGQRQFCPRDVGRARIQAPAFCQMSHRHSHDSSGGGTIQYLKLLLKLPLQLVRLAFWLLGKLVGLILRAMGLGWKHSIATDEDYARFVSFYLKRRRFFRIHPAGDAFTPGADLIASKSRKTYAVSCKFSAEEVPENTVYEALSGMSRYSCDAAMIVTNSTLTHGAWNLANSNSIAVLEKVSPEFDGSPLTAEDCITPKNTVAFAIGCVAFGVFFSSLYPTHTLGLSAYFLMALGCLLLSWILCTLLVWLVRRQLNS